MYTPQIKKTTGPHNNKVLLKLSGDGTRFSASSAFIFLTFSFPTLATDVLAASGIQTHTVNAQTLSPAKIQQEITLMHQLGDMRHMNSCEIVLLQCGERWMSW